MKLLITSAAIGYIYLACFYDLYNMYVMAATAVVVVVYGYLQTRKK